MTTSNNVKPISAAPTTGSNSNGNKIEFYMKGVIAGLDKIGDGAVSMENGTQSLMGNLTMLFQMDDFISDRINRYLSHGHSKLATKETREALQAWFHDYFEITKPKKGAIQSHQTRYQNKVRSLTTAMNRVRDNAKRGLVFVQNGKDIVITADSYSTVMGVKSDAPVAVETKTKDKEKTTWAALAPQKDKPVKAVAATPLTVSNANFALICQTVKTATEAVSAEKMDGTQTLAALDAFFALQILLNLKQDKAALTKYEEVTKAQAA